MSFCSPCATTLNTCMATSYVVINWAWCLIAVLMFLRNHYADICMRRRNTWIGPSAIIMVDYNAQCFLDTHKGQHRMCTRNLLGHDRKFCIMLAMCFHGSDRRHSLPMPFERWVFQLFLFRQQYEKALGMIRCWPRLILKNSQIKKTMDAWLWYFFFRKTT